VAGFEITQSTHALPPKRSGRQPLQPIRYSNQVHTTSHENYCSYESVTMPGERALHDVALHYLKKTKDKPLILPMTLRFPGHHLSLTSNKKPPLSLTLSPFPILSFAITLSYHLLSRSFIKRLIFPILCFQVRLFQEGSYYQFLQKALLVFCQFIPNRMLAASCLES
jgi:hypothetical protein